jgi:hypothetical protein
MNGDSILIRCLVGDDSELGEAEAVPLSASCAGAVVSTTLLKNLYAKGACDLRTPEVTGTSGLSAFSTLRKKALGTAR